MAGIISSDLVETTFDYGGNLTDTGMIINPNNSNFQLNKDTIKDLIMVISYQLNITP